MSSAPDAMQQSQAENQSIQTVRVLNQNSIPKEERITVEWNDLQCSLPLPNGALENITKALVGDKRYKRVLFSVNGTAVPGDFIAILGPPNAGKTTLLNILGGVLESNYTGEVKVNGHVLDADDICHRSSFIPQHETFLNDFTVRETMWMACETKHPTSTPRRTKNKLVANQLERYGLMDVRRVPVQKISEKHNRLLSIAVNLIRQQPLILLDEPFKNIDNAQAHTLIKIFRYLAYKGHTVICATNAPTMDMYRYFTKIYLMTEGRVIYSGLPNEVIPILAERNYVCPEGFPLSEFLLQVASKMYGGVRQLAELESSKQKEVTDVAPQSLTNMNEEDGTTGANAVKRRPSLGYVRDEEASSQRDLISIVFNRLLFYTFRSATFMSLRQTLNIGMIVIFASIFKSTGYDGFYTLMNVGFIGVFLTAQSMMSLFASTIKTPLVDNVGLYESLRALYTPLSYFIARIWSDLVFELMFGMSSGIFLYYLTFQVKNEGRIFFYLITVLVTNFCHQAIGMFLGLSLTPTLSLLAAAGFYIYSLTFSGIMFNLSDAAFWLRPFSYLSILFYSRNIIMIDLYGNGRKIDCTVEKDEPAPNRTCLFTNGTDLLRQLDIQENQFYPSLVILVAILLCLWTISYNVFVYRLSRRRF